MSGFLDILLGKRLTSADESEHRVGVLTGIPLLGLDALGSAAYGPEAALTVLIPIGAAGLAYISPLTGIILGLLLILSMSYRQTIFAYPQGGGGYTVARENLGMRIALLAAAALMLDYVLNVSVGIAAGVGALVSAIPALHRYVLPLCLAILVFITLVNLRGVKESGTAFAGPTYLFVISLLLVMGWGVAETIFHHGAPAASTIHTAPALTAGAKSASVWLLLRAFASGCTAMTGVEAISNGVPAFKDPAPKRAALALLAISIILGVLLANVAYLAHVDGIMATDPNSPAYQSILSQIVAKIAGRGWIYYVTMGSVLTVLCLSANTSFAGFPRLCRLVAEDGYLPNAFANTGRRLVYSEGIVVLAILTGAILVMFGGVTDRLIPLFAIGAFLTFTLSQAGMVHHWLRRRHEASGNARSIGLQLSVNLLGAIVTAIALVIIIVAKFKDGAWVTLILVPAALYLFYRVKSHYERVAEQIRNFQPLDLTHLQPPIVVIPMQEWSQVSCRALRYALKQSHDVHVLHIKTEDVPHPDNLTDHWENLVVRPCREAGINPPELNVINSPYRRLFQPLIDQTKSLLLENPGRQLVVIIPELVESRWWQYLLHNQRAAVLKARLLLSREDRIVVASVPWYLDHESNPCD